MRTSVWYFLQKVAPPDENGCRRWLGGHNNRGYGLFSANGKEVTAHRFAYELFVGPIHSDLWVLHRCDVRDCTEPSHLWLGTAKQNTTDAIVKGRMHRGERTGPSKLTEAEVRQIRALYTPRKGGFRKRGDTGPSIADIAKMFGVSNRAVRAIVTGETWRHLL